MKVIGWQLMRLAAEAESSLVGATVEQLRRSPDRMRLGLVLGSRRGKTYVIIGVRGTTAAFYWTRDKEHIPHWETFERTEAFNRIRSARLIRIALPLLDRVVRFEFERQTENDNVRRVSLVAGWLGSSSNLWLLDPTDDTVLESLHADPRHASGSSAHKTTLIMPPPPDLIDWRVLTFPQYRELRYNAPDLALDDFVRRAFWGIDSGLSRQIEERWRKIRESENAPGDITSPGEWEEFQALVQVCRLAIDPRTPLSLAANGSDPADIELRPDDTMGASSLAELLAMCDSRTPSVDSADDERARLANAIEVTLKKNERRLNSLARTVAEAGRAEDYKRQGDLLAANRNVLERGMKDVTIADWESGQPITVVLNPARSPQQNIADYYRKARRAHDAIQTARAEEPRLRRVQDRLREAMAKLVSGEETYESLRGALDQLGLVASASAKSGEPTQPRLPYREFVIGKQRLWVGKSSRDNDNLTLHHARPQDLFFHVHGASGSHVILRRDSKDVVPAKEIILLAAQVAAFFSKAKHAGLVPVVYTEARHVRKPRKSPAGTVTLERERTVMVRPLPPPGYHERTSAE